MRDRKGKIHQVACVPFYVFRGCLVVEDQKRVSALEKEGDERRSNFNLILLAHQDKHARIVFADSLVGLVVRECREDQHDLVQLAAERAVDLVCHKPRFA